MWQKLLFIMLVYSDKQDDIIKFVFCIPPQKYGGSAKLMLQLTLFRLHNEDIEKQNKFPSLLHSTSPA